LTKKPSEVRSICRGAKNSLPLMVLPYPAKTTVPGFGWYEKRTSERNPERCCAAARRKPPSGRSPAAPELPGLCEVARVDVGFGPLADQLPPLLAGRLQLGLQRAELSSAMGRMAAKMAGERYGDAAWTRRR
jgi:hypothetical protein